MDKYKIDYSKWDRMEDSDEEDGDHYDTRTFQRPHVTTFDRPTRVTFGGSESQEHDFESATSQTSSNSDSIAKTETLKPNTDRIEDSDRNASPADELKPSPPNPEGITKRPIATDKYGIPLSWTENGAAVPLFSHKEETSEKNDECFSSENEATETFEQSQLHSNPTMDLSIGETMMVAPYKYVWSQDRMMVHIRIPIALHQKAKYNVRISNLLPYRDRHCATYTTDSATQRLSVTSTSLQQDSKQQHSDSVVLEDTLTHPVYSPEDYDEDEVDWSIQNYSRTSSTVVKSSGENSNTNTNESPHLFPFEKYILITLYKATPMMGMTFWWKRCLLSETKDATIVHNSNDIQRKQAFQKVWDEAHEQFQQSVQSRTKYSL